MEILLGPLNAILCAIEQLAFWIADRLIEVCNLFIAGVATFLLALLTLLPNMPTGTYTPSGTILGMINWLLPVGQMVATLTLVASMWLVLLVVRVGLKWAKAL
jgi:hypothetical protein